VLQLVRELKSSDIEVVEVHPWEGWHIPLCPRDFHRNVKTVSFPTFLYYQLSRRFRSRTLAREKVLAAQSEAKRVREIQPGCSAVAQTGG